MAIIAKVQKQDTWGDGNTKVLAKFIPEDLYVIEGSEGWGGKPASDPVESAKIWAEENNFINWLDGDCIVVIDTQAPVDNIKILSPTHLERNDYRLSWES